MRYKPQKSWANALQFRLIHFRPGHYDPDDRKWKGFIGQRHNYNVVEARPLKSVKQAEARISD